MVQEVLVKHNVAAAGQSIEGLFEKHSLYTVIPAVDHVPKHYRVNIGWEGVVPEIDWSERHPRSESRVLPGLVGLENWLEGLEVAADCPQMRVAPANINAHEAAAASDVRERVYRAPHICCRQRKNLRNESNSCFHAVSEHEIESGNVLVGIFETPYGSLELLTFKILSKAIVKSKLYASSQEQSRTNVVWARLDTKLG